MRELSNRQFREALRRIVATRARRESATIFRVYAITVGLKLTGPFTEAKTSASVRGARNTSARSPNAGPVKMRASRVQERITLIWDVLSEHACPNQTGRNGVRIPATAKNAA
eukprot:1196104-Prorocentrum_minimum.AAC.7